MTDFEVSPALVKALAKALEVQWQDGESRFIDDARVACRAFLKAAEAEGFVMVKRGSVPVPVVIDWEAGTWFDGEGSYEDHPQFYRFAESSDE